MDLKNKKTVITGSAVRVGRNMVKTFADRGAKIVIHCHNSETAGLELLEEIGGTSAGHSLWKCDLADSAQLEKEAPEILRGTDILINNASTYIRKKIMVETPEDAKAQWAVNFWAPVLLMQIFASVNTCGTIINILDQGICRPDETSFSYALSKKTLADATRSAALQLAPDFRVNGIAPGPMLPPAAMPDSKMEKTLRKLPLARPVSLDDLCSGAVFLAENESVTGTILFIDCGQNLCQEPH